MKTLKITLVLFMFTNTIAASEATTCDQRKGTLTWSGQCVGGEEIVALTPITVEANTTESNVTVVAKETEPAGEGFTAKKALAYAALPVVVAGTIVAAIVIAPVWIIKSIFK